jgi:hypothetical protein
MEVVAFFHGIIPCRSYYFPLKLESIVFSANPVSYSTETYINISSDSVSSMGRPPVIVNVKEAA